MGFIEFAFVLLDLDFVSGIVWSWKHPNEHMYMNEYVPVDFGRLTEGELFEKFKKLRTIGEILSVSVNIVKLNHVGIIK